MKKNIILFLTIIALTINIPKVKAEINITDVSPDNYSLTAKVSGVSPGASFTVELHDGNGALVESPAGTSYFIILVNSQNDSKPNIRDYISDSGTDKSGWNIGELNSVSGGGKTNFSKDWYILKGYEWAYVIKRHHEGSGKYLIEITSSAVKIEKPALASITERYKYFVFGNNNTATTPGIRIFTLFPVQGSGSIKRYGDHVLVTKIGRVSDNSILRNIRDNKSGAYNELMNYAKNNAGITYEYEDEAHTTDATSLALNGLSVVNGAYYYVYTKYKNSEGLYRDIEGISLVMAEYNMITTEIKFTADLGDNNEPSYESNPVEPIEEPVTQPVEEPPVTNEIITNPKTGSILIGIAWTIGALTIGYSIIYFKKIFIR